MYADDDSGDVELLDTFDGTSIYINPDALLRALGEVTNTQVVSRAKAPQRLRRTEIDLLSWLSERGAVEWQTVLRAYDTTIKPHSTANRLRRLIKNGYASRLKGCGSVVLTYTGKELLRRCERS